MKAVAIQNQGPESRLVLEERPTPRPGNEEVLIRAKAAGVNRGDLLQRQGRYPPPPGASDLPGLEVAGEIAAVGPGAQRFAVGTRVCALLSGGGYAEYVTAHQDLCFEIPGPLEDAAAAALPEALFTVWDNVFRRGRLRQGETLLVQGGTSGIGMVAITLARHFGARVLATAGTQEKCEALAQRGALPINYKAEDFKERVLELTENQGVDVILDLIGGPALMSHLELLRTEGRLVLIAVQGGYRTDINLLPILTRRLTLTGSTLRSRDLLEKKGLATEIRNQLWPLIANREVEPVIAARFPLEDAEAAHALMTSSQHIGKIILEMPP